jgi:hypothetical protein
MLGPLKDELRHRSRRRSQAFGSSKAMAGSLSRSLDLIFNGTICFSKLDMGGRIAVASFSRYKLFFQIGNRTGNKEKTDVDAEHG